MITAALMACTIMNVCMQETPERETVSPLSWEVPVGREGKMSVKHVGRGRACSEYWTQRQTRRSRPRFSCFESEPEAGDILEQNQ
jgi:hypothetical protein